MRKVLREAGVTVLTGYPTVAVLKAGDRVAGVVVATDRGPGTILGKVTVDATGDADLAAWAGAPCEYGNGRDACGEDGHVQVQAYTDTEYILVDVDDNGCGIPQELHQQVFEPFFTTKDPGSGTGLGLALVYSIMDDMGGSVQMTSPLQAGPNPGTRFTLKLARASYGSEFEL